MPKRRLLLVDDDAALLRLMRTYLERLGYEIQSSATREEARAALQQNSDIELAIVDLSLMDGRDSLTELAGISPDTRVLVCSGSPFEIASLPKNLQPRFGFLQKPFLPKMLAEAVEELLNRNIAV